MTNLYPLKFKPFYKDKIWGGNKIRDILNKDFGELPNCGESWEISGVQDNLSVVSNGFLHQNNIQELIEVYMGDLVGDKVYQKFGIEFPLLIKYIDANDDLSIQVHPDDELSKERHSAYGKTEMWYVIQADEGAKLISGFSKETNQDEYLKNLQNNTLTSILNADIVKPGDVFFIPAGRVHAIGAGILLAEIQQTSDVTYRIFDYNRKDSNGETRELHTDLALDAIDYSFQENYKTIYNTTSNKTEPIVGCQYFKTNFVEFDSKLDVDYNQVDSFVIYMCIEGECQIICCNNHCETLKKGETVLIPAVLKNFLLEPISPTKLLEVYIP